MHDGVGGSVELKRVEGGNLVVHHMDSFSDDDPSGGGVGNFQLNRRMEGVQMGGGRCNLQSSGWGAVGEKGGNPSLIEQ